jgi:hypothetical protein
LTPGPDREKNENCYENKKPFLHLLSL